MKQEVKVSFCLKKNEMKEDGKCPVMARLTVGKSETTFSAKMTIPVSLWAAGRVDCFFYSTFQESIVDVGTIHNFLEYLKVYQLKDLMLIMDRGFFSTGNILGLLDSPVGITFL
ncbi:hypothetical protein AGMMS50239_39070 [Bacteroidia bacterium]|nr:hypothetical protein AGMMS50239_39070 [Bacteroidia bacterium]